ncbi:MAG TPA: S8 family serine peptidase [Polyangiaceae bacterium]|nr:S8 family serine peptidase [Polyangiaceae bacterium]
MTGARAPRRRLPRLGFGAAVLIWSSEAAAQVPLDALDEFLARPGRGLLRSGWITDAAALTNRSPALRAVRLGVGARRSVLRAPESELLAALGVGLRWSPPRHLLMDRARTALRLDAARTAGAGSGQGVVIGIVDSGVDAAHPDLRNADGTTRLAWWLDFASAPAGLQPELEAALGCSGEAGLRCQVLSASDIDARLADDFGGNDPRDAVGHGTIVASIAAGNGSWGGGSPFAGVAPEATLIAVRVTGAAGAITDSDVLLATQFVFDRARELGMPAVVNLSLGSDFGAHDGASELSAGLAELVGPDQPGRAIVVAAGNSGQLHYDAASSASQAYGIHAERVATANEPAHAPLITPYPFHGLDTTDASLFIWLDLYPPDALSVRLVLPDGQRLEPVGIDQSRVDTSGDLAVAIVHGIGDAAGREEVRREWTDGPLADVLPSVGSAVVLIDGRWPAGKGFVVEIEGEGRAELWVQSEGDLAPEAGTTGALFVGASSRSTVTIPAAHAGLIAAGASVDRLEWTDYTGASVSVATLPVSPAPTLGAAAFFSSAGPSSSGAFKPDLVAPGAFVISSLSSAADPRRGASGIFSGGLCAGLGCQIISNGYAVTAGTSMAAPMVSGAAALLLERQPQLTQSELRGLLIAGAGELPSAPDVASRAGAGTLDMAGSMQAANAAPRSRDERPSTEQSRLRVASEHAVADASRSLAALLWLRDDGGQPFDAELDRIDVALTGGELRSSVRRIAPGLYEFVLSAVPPAPERLSIDVRIDAEPLLAFELPIDGGVAPSRAEDSGGCTFAPGRGGRSAAASVLGALALLLSARARRRSPSQVRAR